MNKNMNELPDASPVRVHLKRLFDRARRRFPLPPPDEDEGGDLADLHEATRVLYAYADRVQAWREAREKEDEAAGRRARRLLRHDERDEDDAVRGVADALHTRYAAPRAFLDNPDDGDIPTPAETDALREARLLRAVFDWYDSRGRSGYRGAAFGSGGVRRACLVEAINLREAVLARLPRPATDLNALDEDGRRLHRMTDDLRRRAQVLAEQRRRERGGESRPAAPAPARHSAMPLINDERNLLAADLLTLADRTWRHDPERLLYSIQRRGARNSPPPSVIHAGNAEAETLYRRALALTDGNPHYDSLRDRITLALSAHLRRAGREAEAKALETAEENARETDRKQRN